jgi:hypothetical protein
MFQRHDQVAWKQSIERGQRYRDVSPGRFGALGTEWIVDAVFQGTDGVVYAQLVCASDLTQQKTLSVHALNDRRLFQRY